MSEFEVGLLVFYGLVLTMLVVFGLHKYFLLYLYLKYKNNKLFEPAESEQLPVVTVQLPIFNEKYVIGRLLESVCSIDYPKELLEVQVLDDSTDETTNVARSLVEKYKRRGFDISYIHRTDRTGFKAGALEAGLEKARGGLLAIFDADFAPEPDFLRKTVGYFQKKEVGMVQTRWGHINRGYSLLTRIQSMFLDGHFIIEHIARNRSGRFFNFNGTAGIWRKQAIIDAGGWQHDTITEDLDLSYRAQLAGWQFIYVPDVVAPAELPVEMNAYKVQQHRWAKGSVQTAKKLLPVIWRSDIPLFVKCEASAHLFSNFTYLFMTIPSLLMPIILNVQMARGWDWMVYVYLFVFFSASLSVIVYYLVSQTEGNRDWRNQVPFLPVLMSLGIGLSVNNARAVLEALFNKSSEFKRTPKYRIENKTDSWNQKKYRVEFNFQPLLELALGCYFTVAFFSLLSKGVYASVPFFVLFQFGFIYVGLMSLLQGRKVNLFVRQSKVFVQNTLLMVLKRLF